MPGERTTPAWIALLAISSGTGRVTASEHQVVELDGHHDVGNRGRDSGHPTHVAAYVTSQLDAQLGLDGDVGEVPLWQGRPARMLLAGPQAPPHGMGEPVSGLIDGRHAANLVAHHLLVPRLSPLGDA